MDTALLADLIALSETLNFSRAAEKRNITQPAFGRRIRALEEWSGLPLVDRSTHRLKITPGGKIVLAAAADVLNRLEKAKHELDQAKTASGTLTFAATHALSFTFFPGWFQSLGPSASALPIRMLSDNMRECERMMSEGSAQFLLCHYHPESEIRLQRSEYRHLELASDQLLPVSARTCDGKPLFALPGLESEPVPHIAFDESSGMGRILAAAIPERAGRLHLKHVLTSHLAMVLKALALEGKGIAWIPGSIANSELGEGGKLTVAGSDEWVVGVKIVLIRPKARMSELAERFWAAVESGAVQSKPPGG
ncbi:LysR substrate-binding domain-containing protein [Aliirhizobium cellulosilyticum]|uniref:DNA-binding transcriptional LysR family regulator n=1 Tax=Aliirhizobium cellulosilyticum TaxID=393664 RepID=A0A7W6V0M3_9HYPH|nr:LysR substrate-binding domain-containing protein [Rhizobium cellulosilyticum]MBB4349453.1 DNA-binding transcriptional LysR family regulator [Rhizobium cellulosilyticum]MBB4412325.1 DNA-binding transcriptional LysR family regulator [Rhizobium cellulosilyticum]MBB4446956.1 DNA-binding transcriptional LysR family regulator [Rhizobium cellulosilyticum]